MSTGSPYRNVPYPWFVLHQLLYVPNDTGLNIYILFCHRWQGLWFAGSLNYTPTGIFVFIRKGGESYRIDKIGSASPTFGIFLCFRGCKRRCLSSLIGRRLVAISVYIFAKTNGDSRDWMWTCARTFLREILTIQWILSECFGMHYIKYVPSWQWSIVLIVYLLTGLLIPPIWNLNEWWSSSIITLHVEWQVEFINHRAALITYIF